MLLSLSLSSRTLLAHGVGVCVGPNNRQTGGTHPYRPQTVGHLVVMATTTPVNGLIPSILPTFHI